MDCTGVIFRLEVEIKEGLPLGSGCEVIPLFFVEQKENSQPCHNQKLQSLDTCLWGYTFQGKVSS